MIEFLSGCVSFGFLIGALFFLRFWKKTSDRLFLAFAIAFALMSLNQVLAQVIGAADERVGYTYVLRVVGFVIILAGILEKNVRLHRRQPTRPLET